MHKNFVVFLKFLIIIITPSMSDEIFSYQDVKQRHDIPEGVVFKELEEIYFNSFSLYANKFDPVCALSDGKKRSLCEILFTVNYYESMDILLNKTALYLKKLTCVEKDLNLEYINSHNSDVNLKQRMYSCPGRHHIIRTSFIEDNHYDKIYLSAGYFENSVIVYGYRYSNHRSIFSILDYIENVKLSQLQDMSITTKDVTEELKLNNIVSFSEISYDELDAIYIQEQGYYSNLENDPICNLEYEKKISLCHVVLGSMSMMYENMSDITLNEVAVYLYSMKCITRPIWKNILGYQILLTKKQDLYPCYGRKKTTEAENTIMNEYIKYVFLSKGPRRNSVFIYICMNYKTTGNIFVLAGMIENADLRSLEPYNLTLEDIKSQSELTHAEVLKIIEFTEISYNMYTSYIALNTESNSSAESALINQVVLHCENSWDQYFWNRDKEEFNTVNVSYEKSKVKNLKDEAISIEQQEIKTKLLKLSNEKSLFEDQITETGTKEFFLVGAQMLKMLVDKKREELKQNASKDDSSIAKERIKKKQELRKLKKEIAAKFETQKLQLEVGELIKRMENFVHTKIKIVIKSSDDEGKDKNEVKESKKKTKKNKKQSMK